MSEPDTNVNIIPNALTVPDVEPFEWGGGSGVDSSFASPSSPWLLVNEKFDATMAHASEMLERLVGTDGNSGYLGNLNSIIESLPAPNIGVTSLVIPDLSVDPDSRPTPSLENLDLDFPSFTGSLGILENIPQVDSSAAEPGVFPDDVTEAIVWFEENYDTTLFDTLYNRLTADLTNGVGGLGGTIEQEIYDRAIARQTADNDRLYDEVDNLYSGQRWDIPSGAYISALEEVSAKIANKNLDLNTTILKEQTELAQKNQQFVVKALGDLETVLRDYASKKNDRALDYAKAVAANSIAIFAENVKGYIARAEAAKLYVQVQVENLKGIVAYNAGLVESFSAEVKAYGFLIDAKKARNTAITDIFEAENKGYDSETKAISANQKTMIDSWQLKIDNARIQLDGEIANADTTLKGYASESALREKVAEAMANIAMQSVASAYGAVNASAGLSYSGSESQSESVSHSESRSVGINHSTSQSNSYSASEAASESTSGSYIHTYEEK